MKISGPFYLFIQGNLVFVYFNSLYFLSLLTQAARKQGVMKYKKL